MASPLENARKRLAALREEMAGVKRFIEMYAQFSDELVAAQIGTGNGNSEETFPHKSFVVDTVDNSRRERRSGPTPRELVDMTERLIREVGRPMTRGEIVAAFHRRDIEIPAQDKKRYIGTIVWRNKAKFLNIEGRGYWLRDSPPGTRQIPPDAQYSDLPEEDASESAGTSSNSDLFE